LVSTLHSFT